MRGNWEGLRRWTGEGVGLEGPEKKDWGEAGLGGGWRGGECRAGPGVTGGSGLENQVWSCWRIELEGD